MTLWEEKMNRMEEYMNQQLEKWKEEEEKKAVNEHIQNPITSTWFKEEEEKWLAYYRGRGDLWLCLQKIMDMDWKTRKKIFQCRSLEEIIEKYTVKKVMELVEEYEEQQEIRVGDEIYSDTRAKRLIITFISYHTQYWSGINIYGEVEIIPREEHKEWEKTGRHFPIDEMLKQMRKKGERNE